MADSRRAAERLVNQMQHVVEAQRRVIYFLLSLIAAFLTTYFVSTHEAGFTEVQQFVLFILVFAVALWISEAIPPFSVGLLIVGLLIFLLGRSGANQQGTPNYIDVETFARTWSDSVIWIMLGGFFLAEALKKTGLDKDLFRFSVSNIGDKPQNIVLGIMLVTAVASMVISNTATAAMMIASISPFIHQIGSERNISKVLLIAVPSAAAIGGMGTIIGSPPNVIAVDAINSMLADRGPEGFKIGFLEWMLAGVPVMLFLLLVFWQVLIRYYAIKKEKIILELPPKDVPSSRGEAFQKRMVLGVLITTVLLWLTSSLHGIPAAAVSGIPIIFLPMVSIVTGEDVRKLPWETLMLVAGGLSLGLAIKESGLASFFVEKLQDQHFNHIFLTVVFALATVLFSNVMSNTATATILIPVASIIPGVDPIPIAIIIGLCASCSLFLPVSSPPNAIAFSTGFLKQSDFRLGGTVLGLLGPLVAILWVSFLLSLFF